MLTRGPFRRRCQCPDHTVHAVNFTVHKAGLQFIHCIKQFVQALIKFVSINSRFVKAPFLYRFPFWFPVRVTRGSAAGKKILFHALYCRIGIDFIGK